MAAFKALILSFNARFMQLAAQAKHMQLFSIRLFSFIEINQDAGTKRDSASILSCSARKIPTLVSLLNHIDRKA